MDRCIYQKPGFRKLRFLSLLYDHVVKNIRVHLWFHDFYVQTAFLRQRREEPPGGVARHSL